MNPCNSGSYIGWLAGEPRYIKAKDGSIFQARFSLKVKREYKNKEGKYEYDYIPMRMYGENRIKFLQHLKKGDALSISASVRSGYYEVNGNKVFDLYLNVEHISYTPGSNPGNNPGGNPGNNSNSEQKKNHPLEDEYGLPFN